MAENKAENIPVFLNDERIFDFMIPMRDGVKLHTLVHLPGGQPGPFPTVLIRSPYNATDGRLNYEPLWIRRGFAWVLQDTRGTGLSEGEFYPNVPEIDDGADTIDFLLKQPWCNGCISMSGGSYVGKTQWMAAKTRGGVLNAITPFIASINYHESSRFLNGAFMLGDVSGWGLNMQRNHNYPDTKPTMEREEIQKHLPLRDLDIAYGFSEPVKFWRDLMDHPAYDEFWEREDLHCYIQDVQCPAFIASGWFDNYQQHAFDAFTLMRTKSGSERARKFTYCVMGPWKHGSEQIGALMPPEAADGTPCDKDENSIERNFTLPHIDYLAKLSENPDADPFPNQAHIRYFVLGSNEWRTAEIWPPVEAHTTSFFLHSDGVANTLNGNGSLSLMTPDEEAEDHFYYDPLHPVPNTGDRFGDGISADQRKLEQRADVLVYTSDALEQDCTIAGRILVELWIASSAPDTDFTAKLVDVYPDGTALNLTNGILRCGYRDSRSERKLMTPGEAYKITVDLWSIAHCFKAGHRIRLDISSSSFPSFDRNPNTGHKFGEDAEIAIARQTIFHTADKPSKLLLPILPQD